jgi:hypothetical protein
MRMRKPERMTDFMNEKRVTVAAGSKRALRHNMKTVGVVVLSERTAFLVRKVMRTSKRLTVGSQSELVREGLAVRPRLELVRARGRGNLLRGDIRDIGPLL